MNNLFKKVTFLFAMLVVSQTSFAQDNASVEMATGLYQSGKIYVVVAVMSVIFLGIAGYLVMLDRKISKLEKK
ncbi:MAG TPA: CcmD family protein [Bacteroidia bacterium]|jgi:CcmD family protein